MKISRIFPFKAFGSISLFTFSQVLIIAIIGSQYNSQANILLISTNAIIGIISVFIIMKNSGILAQTVGTFSLIFFCYLPILESFTGTLYWGGSYINETNKAAANILIILFLILFLMGYNIKQNISILPKINFPTSIKFKTSLIFSLVGFSILSYIIYLYNFDLKSLLIRGGDERQDLNVNLKSSFLLVEFFLRPLVFNIGIFLFFFSRYKVLFIPLSLVLMGLSIFPTGVPRFLAGAMYMPFILHLAFLAKNNNYKFTYISKFFLPTFIVYSLVIIFPVLDTFRRYTTDIQFNVINFNTLLAGHFDSYQMFTRSLTDGEITFGYGFLGVLFFFIPRSVWVTKPIGSAQEVAGAANLYFDNVSMPIIGEFYLNFGYPGVLFGAILLGILIRSIDIIFLRKKQYQLSVQWVFYFQSVGLFMLILRGSLLSAFAYAAAVSLTWFVIWLICRIR